MAAALRRLLDDHEMAAELSAKGLDLVERDFDWERRTDEFAEILDGVSAGRALAPPPPRSEAPSDPDLSVVVLTWDNLQHTQPFVESVRRNTEVPYELIVVDNGSGWEAANYARAAADRAVLNVDNLGFARGMNQGLAAARGRYVAFCNNDTILPSGWAASLLETARGHEQAGIVVPALTAARNSATVRAAPGTEVSALAPFSPPPSGVVFVMRSDIVRALGAWGEEYEIASGEDLDLCFKVWVNDLDIVCDTRVLVEHVGKGSASRLDDWQQLWARNRRRFLDKWSGDGDVPRLDSCAPERFARNRATARAVATWMDRYFSERDRGARRRNVRPRGRTSVHADRWMRHVWERARPHLPPRVVELLRRLVRGR
jgi:GT2 family glycosyltransferase